MLAFVTGRTHYITSRKLRLLAAGVLLVLAAMVIGVPALRAQSNETQSKDPLRVVIKPLVPFVIVEGENYRGFSIDLWQEIAARLGRDYEYQFVETGCIGIGIHQDG